MIVGGYSFQYGEENDSQGLVTNWFRQLDGLANSGYAGMQTGSGIVRFGFTEEQWKKVATEAGYSQMEKFGYEGLTTKHVANDGDYRAILVNGTKPGSAGTLLHEVLHVLLETPYEGSEPHAPIFYIKTLDVANKIGLPVTAWWAPKLYNEYGPDGKLQLGAQGGTQFEQAVAKYGLSAADLKYLVGVLGGGPAADDLIRQTISNLSLYDHATRAAELRDLYDSISDRCFPAHTRIQTSRTTSTAISALRVGDVVAAFDARADKGRGALVPRRVTRLYRNTTTEWIRLRWFDGMAREVITTPGHHFLDELGLFPTIEEMTRTGSKRRVRIYRAPLL
jgi:hypothetical protein